MYYTMTVISDVTVYNFIGTYLVKFYLYTFLISFESDLKK